MIFLKQVLPFLCEGHLQIFLPQITETSNEVLSYQTLLKTAIRQTLVEDYVD